jgi:hypothetical protein
LILILFYSGGSSVNPISRLRSLSRFSRWRDSILAASSLTFTIAGGCNDYNGHKVHNEHKGHNSHIIPGE